MGFTIFDLFKSEQISDDELTMLFKYFDDYNNWSGNEWINTIKLDSLKFYWCSAMTDENNVLGAWSFVTPNSIYLKAPDRSELTGNYFKDKQYWDSHFSLIFPTLLHELYHKYQSQKYTFLLWPLLAIPGLREFTIEPSAYSIFDGAINWIMNYQNNEFNQLKKQLYAEVYDIYYDVDNEKFVENYDVKYCLQRYEEYVDRRKNGETYLSPVVFPPPNFMN